MVSEGGLEPPRAGRRGARRFGLAVSVRKFVVEAHAIKELVALGTLTAQSARFLEAPVVAGLNILVSGGTQAEKSMPAAASGSSSAREDGHTFRP